MRASLSIDDFLRRYRSKLELTLASAEVGLDRAIKISRQAADTFEAVDYFNVIRTSSLVIVGYQESRYINKLAHRDQLNLFDTLFRGPVCMIICSRGNPLPRSMIDLCEQRDIPVFDSALDDSELLDNVRHHLSIALAEHTVEHGVYLEVYNLGIFITGESGVGKSELALDLISRGHRLISDDIIRFSRVEPDVIDGRCPELLTDFMEVRGLGVVNIRAMFGANSLKSSKTLRLIVNMVRLTRENRDQFDRLGNNISTRNILGLDIPEITLPVAPGRNLAVLIEAASRNQLLHMNGYNAGEAFMARQNRKIMQQSSER